MLYTVRHTGKWLLLNHVKMSQIDLKAFTSNPTVVMYVADWGMVEEWLRKFERGWEYRAYELVVTELEKGSRAVLPEGIVGTCALHMSPWCWKKEKKLFNEHKEVYSCFSPSGSILISSERIAATTRKAPHKLINWNTACLLGYDVAWTTGWWWW